MPHRLFALAVAGLITVAASVTSQAQTTVVVPRDGVVSIEEARDIALDFGINRIESIELNTFTRRWEVDGTDLTGRDVDMDIDANTGAVIRIDR